MTESLIPIKPVTPPEKTTDLEGVTIFVLSDGTGETAETYDLLNCARLFDKPALQTATTLRYFGGVKGPKTVARFGRQPDGCAEDMFIGQERRAGLREAELPQHLLKRQ